MTPRERYLAYTYNKHENVPMCSTCKHYIQHYGLHPVRGFYRIHDGHCTEPRCKTRVPFDMCDRWEPKEG